MELNDGQRLKLLATNLKKKLGINHEQFAEMIGISAPHLSHIFGWERITADVKEKVIAALNIAPDYFDRKGIPSFEGRAPAYTGDLDNYRNLVIQLQAQVKEWREKYEQTREELLRLQTEYLEYLKNKQ